MKLLAVATGLVFWTLVIGIAVLAFFPGSDVGDPVAVLQIQPAAAPDAAAPESDSRASGEAAPAPPPSKAKWTFLLASAYPLRHRKPRSSRRLRDRCFRSCRHSPRRPMMLRRRTILASKGPHPLPLGRNRPRLKRRLLRRRRHHPPPFQTAKPARSPCLRRPSPSWWRNRNMARCPGWPLMGGDRSMSMQGRRAMWWPRPETRPALPYW